MISVKNCGIDEINKALQHLAIIYKNSFQYHDLEDIVSITRIKLVKYIPDRFESNIHLVRWVNLFARRFFLNSVRDFCSHNKKFHKHISFLRLDSEEIEDASYKRHIADTNIKAVHAGIWQKIQERPALMQAIVSSDLSRKSIAYNLGLSVRQVRNIFNNIKREVVRQLSSPRH